jgi:ferric-dicitrate binding protein FerR (iron transport regulator)
MCAKENGGDIMNAEEQWKLLELWERVRDGKAGDEEIHALNERVRHDEEARRFLAEAVMIEAELPLQNNAPEFSTRGDEPVAVRWFSARSAMLSAAAAVVAACGVWLITRDPAPVAVLTKAHQCKWGNSALPTLEGGGLWPGTLELIEGMAKLKFNSGAEVVMEAPVSLEIVSAMECRVKKGTVVADVPPQAKGFTVQTPDTKVVDYGTRFGVSASEDGKCLVHVIEGLVEVNRKEEPEAKMLRTGERVDYGGWIRSRVNPEPPDGAEPEPGRWLPGPISDMGDGWQMLTTSFGRGQDTCIQSNPGAIITGTEPFLRVKHTTKDEKPVRKGYSAFDLSRFNGKRVTEAEFILHLDPSDLVFAALVPDATFAIYGVTDEAQDEWSERDLRWKHAPAHDPEAAEKSTPTSAAKLLGKFEIAQGTTRGAFSIKGDTLTSFLNSDRNGIVTLIICRETDETARNGLVHAFATKQNPRNPGPLLRL